MNEVNYQTDDFVQFACTKPLLFTTELHGQRHFYSNGGAMVLFLNETRVYAFSCKHAFGGGNIAEEWANLILYCGKEYHFLEPIHCFTLESPSFQESCDFTDLILLDFGPAKNELMLGSAMFDIKQIFQLPEQGDDLEVMFYPKDKLTVGSDIINCDRQILKFKDLGHENNDFTLRSARGNCSLNNIIGMSGSMAWNKTKQTPCGIVIRGGVSDAISNMYYVNMEHVVNLVKAYCATVPSREGGVINADNAKA